MKRHKVYLGATDVITLPSSGTEVYTGPQTYTKVNTTVDTKNSPPNGSVVSAGDSSAINPSNGSNLSDKDQQTKYILLGAAAIFGIYYLMKKK